MSQEDGAALPVDTIEIVNQHTIGPTMMWTPAIGAETTGLFQHLAHTLHLSDASLKSLRDEAVAILGQCVPPTTFGTHRTGLVVGYVQSGKTMSFTTVAALARDNGFQIIIVITGTSKPLFNQSTERLQTDLRLNSRRDRKWQYFANPTPDDRSAMKGVLADWTDATVPDKERQTVLITVMKHHRHLDNLVQLLRQLSVPRSPTLLIDDEADQAGLNTLVRQGEQSTTYRRLISLYQSLPSHTFLQYTATPQAPLLINMIDVLSPNFAEVLTPGADYVGGKDFFMDQPSLVRPIPAGEIATRDNQPTEPPETLLDALRIFLVGVAAGHALDSGAGNRSMLVHPSQKTKGHKQYFRWISQIRQNWETILELREDDPDRRALIIELQSAYEDLRQSVPDLPSFTDLSACLPRALRHTRIAEVNATKKGGTPHIDWRASYAYILVGGQAMDRGFTVEGLTVTYMPRSLGVGNADTVQQRARFFGYKRHYLGYCRTYLQSAVLNAYRLYVEHEEDIRRQLVEYRGRPLTEWKRAFFLTRSLKPTRDSVLGLDYMRGSFAEQWYVPRAPHESEEGTQANWRVIESFVAALTLSADKGHPLRTEYQSHQVDPAARLSVAYESLLTRLRVTRLRDSQSFTGLLLQIGRHLEQHPDGVCRVYVMSHSGGKWIRRTHQVNDDDEIENIFQGEYPVNPIESKDSIYMRGSIYPGDRRILDKELLTIQIHRVQVLSSDRTRVLGDDVPVIAVWVPAAMGHEWLVQDQVDRTEAHT